MGRLTLAFACSLLLCSLAGCKDDPEHMTMVDAAMLAVDAAPICMGTVEYFGTCADTSACGVCECRTFGHLKKCTLNCANDSECPAPSIGCTSQTGGGFCRQ